MSQQVYDEANIFARIIRGEIPCNKVDECDHTLTFHDISPRAPIHVLVIPKGAYCDWADFAATASAVEMAAFTKAIHRVAELTGISKTGYRVISNTGLDSHQEVPHLHMHVLGGAHVGPLVLAKSQF